LLIPLISLGTFFVTSMITMVVAAYVVHGEVTREMFGRTEAMQAVSSSRIGLLLLVTVPQLALVLPALLAAWLSPIKVTARLSLVRGHWPLWAWWAAAVTTPLIGWVSSVIVTSLLDESENLKMMSDIFRGHGESGFLVPLALLIGATPALCEELLFRGYVQTRLTGRLGALWGILLSSLLFAAFHMDGVHIVAVFPLGCYLGLIAWRSGSLLPAMLAHFVNNAVSVVAVVLAPEQADEMPTAEMGLFLFVVAGVGLIGAALTTLAFWQLPTPPETAASAGGRASGPGPGQGSASLAGVGSEAGAPEGSASESAQRPETR
jgi:membrane protease YdiL (CAAX protease family)